MRITYKVTKREDLEKNKSNLHGTSKDKFTFQINVGKNNATYSGEMNKVLFKSKLLMMPALCVFIFEIICESVFLLRLEGITDNSLAGNLTKTQYELEKAIPYLAMMFLCAILGLWFRSLYISKSIITLKQSMFHTLIRKDPIKFQKSSIATYISLFTNHIHAAESNYFFAHYRVASGILQIIAGVILFLYVDWRLLAVSAAIFLALYIIMSVLVVFVENKAENLYESFDSFTTKTREFLCAFPIIKIYNLIDRTKKEMNNEIDTLQESQASLDKAVINLSIIMQLLISSICYGIFIYTTMAVISGSLTAGEIVFLFSAFAFIMMPGLSVLQIRSQICEGAVALKEIDKLCFFEKDSNEASDKSLCLQVKDIKDEKRGNQIFIDNISFNYGRLKIFENITLSFQKGKKYLIIGESGCGKTTLLKLLLGLLQPAEGGMYLNGDRYEEIDRNFLHSVISYLPQVPVLFNDSLFCNICINKSGEEGKSTNAQDGEIEKKKFWNAVNKAELSKYIDSLVEKELFVINESGTNVSGGEKTRIALARALFAESDYLLLDEPYANLDMPTSVAIEKTLLNLEDKCVIVVSHVIHEENLDAYDRVIRLPLNG